MRRLQKIFAALTELAAEPLPSKAIAEAWTAVKSHAHNDPDTQRSLKLIDRVITAVIGIAEDNEKPKAAKADA